MPRSYLATDMITLPRLSVADAVALATALLARSADAGTLPAAIQRAADQTSQRLALLRDLVRGNAEIVGQSPAAMRASDRALDAAWGALSDFTNAFVRLSQTMPDASHDSSYAGDAGDASDADEVNRALIADARLLRDALFYDGLRFLRRKFREQWVESQTRLDIIASRELEPVIERLGGAAIVATVRRMHHHYGEALGITAEAEERNPARVTDALLALRNSLRSYVLQVAAHADAAHDDGGDSTGNGVSDGAAALAESLLEPLANWQDAISSASGEDDSAEDTPLGESPAGEIEAGLQPGREAGAEVGLQPGPEASGGAVSL